MGLEGLANLAKFVQDGGTLIVEGSTTTLFPAYGLTAGVTVEEPAILFARGSILKAQWADMTSPIAYGYEGPALPVYFSQAPVLRVGAASPGGPGMAAAQSAITPNAGPAPVLASMEPRTDTKMERPPEQDSAQARQMARSMGVSVDEARARVVLKFPTDPHDMLLSGSLMNGHVLSGRAVVVDVPLGKGHLVMFATRPYWRWQTQGLFFLGFNAILNWNDLDAGREKPAAPSEPNSSRP